MKVKIINGFYFGDTYTLEKDINNFIESNNIVVKDIKILSKSERKDIALIMYEELKDVSEREPWGTNDITYEERNKYESNS